MVWGALYGTPYFWIAFKTFPVFLCWQKLPSASYLCPARYVRALVLANRLDYVDLDALLGRQWREVPPDTLGFLDFFAGLIKVVFGTLKGLASVGVCPNTCCTQQVFARLGYRGAFHHLLVP